MCWLYEGSYWVNTRTTVPEDFRGFEIVAYKSVSPFSKKQGRLSMYQAFNIDITRMNYFYTKQQQINLTFCWMGKQSYD